MNNSQWFVCLSFAEYDLLLPQSLVEGSSWTGEGSTLRCNGRTFSTTVIPHLEQLSLCDCRVITGELGDCFRGRGIIGVHFAANRVQYLIDDRFLLIAAEKGEFFS